MTHDLPRLLARLDDPDADPAEQCSALSVPHVLWSWRRKADIDADAFAPAAPAARDSPWQWPARAGRLAATLLVASTTTLFGATGLSAAVAPTASAAACADVDVDVARGTFEPGRLGLIVGDRVFSALRHTLPSTSLSGYRVNYPADLDQPASVQQGNADLVAHVMTQAAVCPHQRFILVGYSQGANVVDNALGVSSAGAVVGGPIVAALPASIEPRIAAVLLFGSPGRLIGRSITGVYQNRAKDYCARGDPVCQNGGLNPLAHFSYGRDADDAAAFAAGKL